MTTGDKRPPRADNTQMIQTPKRRPPAPGVAPLPQKTSGGGGGPAPRAWRKFEFRNLEKVSRLQGELVKRLEWMLPTVTSTGEVSQSVKARLKEMLEEDVSLTSEYVHVVGARGLRRYVGEPTFLAVLAPQPHKTRGFLECEIGLAHAAIDMLLGGAGEAVSLRPLTDIEEGVMTYVILETLKALAPSLDPSLPKLRLEGVCHGFEEALSLVGDESHLAVVQLKASFGSHQGYVRLFIPASVLATANPPPDAPVRAARRADAAQKHIRRLSRQRAWLRAEIGLVEISSADLAQLRERDVIIVEQLSMRPDTAEGGTAVLRVGLGRGGHAEAQVAIDEGRFKATVTGFVLNDGPPGPAPMAEDQASTLEPTDSDGLKEGKPVMDETLKSQEGAELLNDIPLQVSVELARVPISAEEVLSLKVGQVIDLNRVPGEPIDLSVNGKVVARGELVEIEGNLGVRVLSLNG